MSCTFSLLSNINNSRMMNGAGLDSFVKSVYQSKYRVLSGYSIENNKGKMSTSLLLNLSTSLKIQ